MNPFGSIFQKLFEIPENRKRKRGQKNRKRSPAELAQPRPTCVPSSSPVGAARPLHFLLSLTDKLAPCVSTDDDVIVINLPTTTASISPEIYSRDSSPLRPLNSTPSPAIRRPPLPLHFPSLPSPICTTRPEKSLAGAPPRRRLFPPFPVNSVSPYHHLVASTPPLSFANHVDTFFDFLA